MSWIGRSKANRKRDRRVVPEVRLQARTGRGPLGRAAARILLFLVFIGVLAVGGTALVVAVRDQWLHRIEVFALRQLDISTDGVLTRAEIRRLAGLETGRNLLAVDLPELQARLLRHPRVAAVSLDRALPDTLRIEVQERTPVARVPGIGQSSAPAAYLLDELGFVMFPSAPGTVSREVLESESALPILIGVRLGELKVGSLAVDASITAALRLLAAHAGSPISGQVGILSIDVSREGELAVVTSQGSQLTFAPRPDDPWFEMAVARWGGIQEETRRKRLVIHTLDLSITNNIPVRWREANAGEESPPPRPARSQRRPVRNDV